MVFSSGYVTDATFFDECFSQSLLLLRDIFNRHIAVLFETSVLNEVCILLYFHNNIAALTLMLMLSSKKSYLILYRGCYIYTYLQIFRSWLFYNNVFYTLYFFNCYTLFSIRLFFFFWKTQNISESMFFIIL